MEYIFLLDNNEFLCEQEVLSLLKRYDYKINFFYRKNNGLFVDIDKKLNNNFIDKLGGTKSIGKVFFKGDDKELLNYINKEYFFNPVRKLIYSLQIFSDKKEIFKKAIMSRFKDEKIRAIIKNKNKKIIIKSGKIIERLRKNIDEEFFIFSNKSINFMGKLVFNSNNKISNDVKKIVYKRKNSISIKLVKILINLSGVKEGDMLINPFCDNGIFLFESMIMRLKVIGISDNKNNINNANLLMEKFKFSKKYYKLIKDNPLTIKTSYGEALVCEPNFDFYFNKKPSFGILKKAINNMNEILINLLNNYKGIINSRFVIITPFILTHNNQRYGIEIKKVLTKTKLKIVKKYPINYFKNDEVMGKQIFIFEH